MQSLKKERLIALLFSKNCAPVIFGCSGLVLSDEEIEFFKKTQPMGFIIFGRNVQDKHQLKKLIQDLKSTCNHSNPLILIDQEGGRVARLKAPYWDITPAVQTLVSDDLETTKKNIRQAYTKIAADLDEVGINCNCAPVLDLHVPHADPIMGDRTFHSNPEIVAELGAVAIETLQKCNIIPIMKHIPGHGAALTDSHKELPVINLSYEDLLAHFLPFKMNGACPIAMTAHIVYTAIDPDQPATHSAAVIQKIIREDIGFKGLLVSDDIGMSALTGSYAERTRRALQAGCDGVLHCSGDLSEMREVMEGVS